MRNMPARWRNTSAIARANILFKAAEILASRANDIGRELTREEGKTLKEGIGETGRAVQSRSGRGPKGLSSGIVTP